MSLTDSNTYIEPGAGTAIAISRSQINNSLRSILSNFKSSSAPVSVNITIAGSSVGEIDGMLFRSAETNALYISDSVHVKSSPVGGNFTRVGIGNRIENSITALAANAASYEIGELTATVRSGAGTSNARLYLCAANTRTISDFVDVGIPPANTIVTSMIANNTITTSKLVNSSVTNDKIANTAVTTEKIANTAITTEKIANTAITTEKIANTAITTEKIADESVTVAKISSDVVFIPVGTVLDYAGTSAPTGFLLCEGQAISRSTYSALFAAIGTVWGSGDNSTTFNIPDLRRKVTIGAGGTAVSGPNNSLGSIGGSETHTLTLAQIPSHTHSYTFGQGWIQGTVNAAGPAPAWAGVTTIQTASSGSGNAHNNMQPSAVMNKIIKI